MFFKTFLNLCRLRLLMIRCEKCDAVISPLNDDDLCEKCREEQNIKRKKDIEKVRRWKQSNHSFSIRERFLKYQKHDLQKGRLFELSFEQAKGLMESDCIYCGRYDNPNGIDRLDSSVGHTKENCVPCCRRCNQMKWDMSLDEFKEHISLIYFNLIEKDDA